MRLREKESDAVSIIHAIRENPCLNEAHHALLLPIDNKLQSQAIQESRMMEEEARVSLMPSGKAKQAAERRISETRECLQRTKGPVIAESISAAKELINSLRERACDAVKTHATKIQCETNRKNVLSAIEDVLVMVNNVEEKVVQSGGHYQQVPSELIRSLIVEGDVLLDALEEAGSSGKPVLTNLINMLQNAVKQLKVSVETASAVGGLQGAMQAAEADAMARHLEAAASESTKVKALSEQLVKVADTEAESIIQAKSALKTAVRVLDRKGHLNEAASGKKIAEIIEVTGALPSETTQTKETKKALQGGAARLDTLGDLESVEAIMRILDVLGGGEEEDMANVTEQIEAMSESESKAHLDKTRSLVKKSIGKKEDNETAAVTQKDAAVDQLKGACYILRMATMLNMPNPSKFIVRLWYSNMRHRGVDSKLAAWGHETYCGRLPLGEDDRHTQMKLKTIKRLSHLKAQVSGGAAALAAAKGAGKIDGNEAVIDHAAGLEAKAENRDQDRTTNTRKEGELIEQTAQNQDQDHDQGDDGGVVQDVYDAQGVRVSHAADALAAAKESMHVHVEDENPSEAEDSSERENQDHDQDQDQDVVVVEEPEYIRAPLPEVIRLTPEEEIKKLETVLMRHEEKIEALRADIVRAPGEEAIKVLKCEETHLKQP